MIKLVKPERPAWVMTIWCTNYVERSNSLIAQSCPQIIIQLL